NAWAGAARLLDEHAAKLWGGGAADRYLNGVSPPTRAWKDLLGYRAAFDAEAATFTGTPGLTFATPFDARLKSDTPGDTADRADPRRPDPPKGILGLGRFHARGVRVRRGRPDRPGAGHGAAVRGPVQLGHQLRAGGRKNSPAPALPVPAVHHPGTRGRPASP